MATLWWNPKAMEREGPLVLNENKGDFLPSGNFPMHCSTLSVLNLPNPGQSPQSERLIGGYTFRLVSPQISRPGHSQALDCESPWEFGPASLVGHSGLFTEYELFSAINSSKEKSHLTFRSQGSSNNSGLQSYLKSPVAMEQRSCTL